MKTTHSSFLLLLILLLLPGCASREAQLQRVARDWCMTIRAVQVLPVYPLTADLQPGDVFLVTQTVADQHTAYERDGFLPLPFKVGRVDPTGYPGHYDTTASALATHTLPRTIGADRQDPDITTSMQLAPAAAFPSYSFTIRNGAAFDLALPVSGVPVGLSAMGSGAASATVTIRDAKTYGVDTYSLDHDVRAWASGRDIKRYLRELASVSAQQDGRRVYLRVVSRVYLAREFDISLRNNSSRGLGVSAGIGSPSGPAGGGANDDAGANAAADYQANLDALNTGISGALESLSPDGIGPRGDVRFVAASAGAVALREVFDQPLVVGYIGFDLAVLDDGSLGPPIATFQVVEHQAVPQAVTFLGAFSEAENHYLDMVEIIQRLDAQATVFPRAAALLGEPSREIYNEAISTGKPVGEAWNMVFFGYLPPSMNDRAERERRYEQLEQALRGALREHFDNE